MAEFMTFRELSDQLGVDLTTIRRNVKRLDLEIRREKTETSKGALVHCLSIDNANALISHFENRNKTTSDKETNSLDRFGYFYIIQLIPEAMPNRVKIGYTDNLEQRLREHQTAAPTATILGHWPCKRSWDQAVMDSVTRENCHLVMNEVYEGELDGFIARANQLFSLLPDNSTETKLSIHSPLNNKKL